MEDRGRHPIGISQNQPHINADVTPQKFYTKVQRTHSGKRSPYGRLAGHELPRVSPQSKCKSAYSCFVNFITF
jgi:hypothetical protein